MVIVWVVIGVILVAVELRHLALYALFGAVGAFGGAVVAGFWPDAILAQGFAVVVVATIGLVGIRPILRRRRWRPTGAHWARGVHGGIVGAEVFALDEIGDEAHPGHVRLVGERWLAQSADRSPIPAETWVVVVAVNGTTLTVRAQPVAERPEIAASPVKKEEQT